MHCRRQNRAAVRGQGWGLVTLPFRLRPLLAMSRSWKAFYDAAALTAAVVTGECLRSCPVRLQTVGGRPSLQVHSTFH